MTKEYRLELIEDYLNNRLGDQKENFENLLSLDKTLKKEYELLKAGHELFSISASVELKNELKNYSKQRSFRRKIIKLLTGTSLLLLMTLLSVYYTLKQDGDKNSEIQTAITSSINSSYNKEDKSVSTYIDQNANDISDLNHRNKVSEKNLITTEPLVEKQPNHTVADSVQSIQMDTLKDNFVIANNVREDTLSNRVTKLTNISQIDRIDDSNIKPVQTDCDLNVDITIEQPNPIDDNGLIELSYNAVYQYSINDAPFSETELYPNLSPGQYVIRALDKNNNCIDTIDVILLKREYCNKEYTRVFNRNFDNQWVVPISHHSAGNLKILDNNFNLIYEHYFDENEDVFWDGHSDSRSQLRLGLHKVLIEYNDGNKCVLDLVIVE